MAIALAAPAFADDKPLILLSVPGMNFPFFVHMMNDGLKAEAAKQGLSTIESDGQDPRPSKPPTSRRRSPKGSRAS